MRKQAPLIEWQIAESEAEWERLQAAPLPVRAPVPHRTRLQRYGWSMGILLFLLVGAGDWLWGHAQAGAHPPVTTMATPAASGAVAPNGDVGVKSTLLYQPAVDRSQQFPLEDSVLRSVHLTDAPGDQLIVAPHIVDQQGDQVVVNLVIRTIYRAQTYRQTRFYRRTTEGWQQTDPDAALWGPERSLETPSFVYHFRQNDAPAVIAVAPHMNELYTSLRRNVGLPIESGAEKLVIEVSVTQPPGHVLPWIQDPEGLHVPSPALYMAPVDLTDADLLAQSIVFPLLAHVLAQATDQHQIGAAWQPLLGALHLWQVWDSYLPLSAWQKEVVQWLYIDLAGQPAGGSCAPGTLHSPLCSP